MFSQACVKNSVHGGGGSMGHVWRGACVAGGMGMHGRGVCLAGGVCGGGACIAGEMAIAAGGTHPPGMHSCYYE